MTSGRIAAVVHVPTLAAIALLALVVRVTVVLAQHITLANDSADYQRLAISLAHGHGFGTSVVAPGGGGTAFRPPLFPLFLSLIYRVVGAHVLAARLTGAVLGVAVVVLIALLSAALWDSTVASVSAGLAAVYPSLVFASTSLMSESLSLPLNLAAILAAVLFRKSAQWRWLVLSGAALGLAILTRPNVAVLVVTVALLVWPERSARRLVQPLALVAVALLVIAPWLIRDRIVMHRWVPITTQDGLVLAGTYNQTSYTDTHLPAAWRPANFDPADAALIHANPHASETQLNSIMQHAATSFIREHPAYPFKVAAYNTARLVDLGGVTYTRNSVSSSYGYPSGFGDAEIAGCLVVLLLAIAGCFSAGIRRPGLAYWTAPILLWLSMSVIEVLPRYRAVIDPFLVQAAALGVLLVWRTLRTRQMGRGGGRSAG